MYQKRVSLKTFFSIIIETLESFQDSVIWGNWLFKLLQKYFSIFWSSLILKHAFAEIREILFSNHWIYRIIEAFDSFQTNARKVFLDGKEVFFEELSNTGNKSRQKINSCSKISYNLFIVLYKKKHYYRLLTLR